MVGLRDLYAEYSEQVQFLVIYIREAHPDDGWVLKETGVTDSTTIEERRDVAETCQAAMQYGIVIYVDEMDDAVMLAYAAWPERLYLIDKDGQIAYAGSKGPWGFEPVELKQAIEQNAGGYCLALEYRAPPRRPIRDCHSSTPHPWDTLHMYTPDYLSLREETDFSWRVSSTYTALPGLTGISLRDFSLNLDAGIELFRKGRGLLAEMFGPEVGKCPLATPPISYGHLNALGAELIFPEGGEVNYVTPCASVEEGIAFVEQDVDFATAGMAPFYIDYKAKLEAAFGGERCGFSYGHEGPLTTAYIILGEGVFTAIYDEPERFKVFLDKLVASTVAFAGFRASVMGQTFPSPKGGGMVDDVSRMFSPAMWPEFVLPFQNAYLSGTTTGPRSAHIEDLRPEHLKYLEALELARFDPSISAKLSPPDLRDLCRVPFGWRLGNFHYLTLTADEVRDWVFQAAADGASSVFTFVADAMCTPETVPKVHAFIEAAKEVERMFGEGASRDDVGVCVSAAGKERFWKNWPHPTTPVSA